MKKRSKQQKDENFPVAGLLIKSSLRPLVNAYYRAARYCDDIADAPDLSARQKLAKLSEAEDIFLGYQKDVPDELLFLSGLRRNFCDELLDTSLFTDLLTAFRQDSRGHTYETWEQLLEYCRYSAAPVGRFMLAVHDENLSTYMPSGVLCTVLQIANHILETGRFIFKMKDNKDVDSLSHTTWRCQYHVVFAPKYRRMVIYGQIKKDIGQILRKLCEQKDIEIIEAEACPDHIHMLISFSPKYSISYVMGYLKGKSSLMIFDRHANLKYKYGNRHFWARGYFVDTVGKNKQRIQEYIKRQLEQDQIADQLSLKEFTDPFTGSKGTKA